MARQKKTDDKQKTNGASLGFEATLWAMADKQRGHMDAAEYKHVVLGLIFLKYISDAFEEKHTALVAEKKKGADPEDKDEYLAENIFWVPKGARWAFIQGKAKQPTIGKIIDDAMVAIEKDNTSLKGVLPKDFNRPALDKHLLGGLIDLIGTIGLGSKEHRSKDILGRVYEYFLSQFASAEGKKGGQFYTPRCVVGVLVEMLAPYKGRVFDPCCGSGGMFVQSEKFVEAHGGRVGDISVYGQESNPTTWKLAMMNLAIRGIEANLGGENADSFHSNKHKDLKADYILANPPFNMSDWGGDRLREDSRWKYGVPPAGNANYAWVQHFIHHLAPNGVAGFVLVNGAMSSNSSGEGEIRKNIIEADLVDCMVALPSHLFYSMYSQVSLWFLSRNKQLRGHRNHHGETLFIDARNLGLMVDRTHRELSEEDVNLIVNTYHSWLHADSQGKYEDVVGFCRSACLAEIRKKGYVLSPSRYVGSEVMGVDDEPIQEKIGRLSFTIAAQIEECQGRDQRLIENLDLLGFDCKSTDSITNISDLTLIGRTELNRRMNATLDEMILAMFRSWFIDFDPVQAKIEGRSTGLPQHIADLFPDTFEDTELGEIPLGWKVGHYSEILTPTSVRIGEDMAEEYSATVRGLELRHVRFNKTLAKAQAKNKRIQRNDLVFGLSRKTLSFGLMMDSIGSVSAVYEVFSVNDGKYIPQLLELYIRYHMRMHMDILKPGAREGQPIDRDYLLSKEVLIPDMRIQREFKHLLIGG